jgi:hypothetical protein
MGWPRGGACDYYRIGVARFEYERREKEERERQRDREYD